MAGSVSHKENEILVVLGTDTDLKNIAVVIVELAADPAVGAVVDVRSAKHTALLAKQSFRLFHHLIALVDLAWRTRDVHAHQFEVSDKPKNTEHVEQDYGNPKSSIS